MVKYAHFIAVGKQSYNVPTESVFLYEINRRKGENHQFMYIYKILEICYYQSRG
jgi:hypothetical protein